MSSNKQNYKTRNRFKNLFLGDYKTKKKHSKMAEKNICRCSIIEITKLFFFNSQVSKFLVKGIKLWLGGTSRNANLVLNFVRFLVK